MKADDFVSQGSKQWRSQPPLASHRIEETALIKTSHDYQPIYRAARGSKMEPAVGCAADRTNFLVQGWSSPSVQQQLRFAGPAAQLDGRIIQIGIADCSLELVGTIAGQKH